MQLSKFTDYTFRTLIYLAVHQEELSTAQQLATVLNVSEHHLKKVIQKLAKTDYVIATKGRAGGLKLGMEPGEINLGDVLRITEDNLNIVECFSEQGVCQFMTNECKLKGIIHQSLERFIEEFSQYTLEDLL